MFRYARLIKIFITISFQRQLAHRLSFIMAIIGKSLRMGLLIVFWAAVFHWQPVIGGWDFGRTLVFLAFFTTVENLMVITYHRNLFYYFPAMIRKGEFDLLLTKPVSSLFHASFRLIDSMDVASCVVPLCLWSAVFIRHILPFSLLTIFSIIAFILTGYFALFGVSIIISSSAFFFLTKTGTGRAFEGLLRLARFPVDFLPQPFRSAFTFVIPIAFIATVPSQWLFGSLHSSMLIVGILLAALFLILGIIAWRIGLRRYTSASS